MPQVLYGPYLIYSYSNCQEGPNRQVLIKTSPLLVVWLGEPSPPWGPGPSFCSLAWSQGLAMRTPQVGNLCLKGHSSRPSLVSCSFLSGSLSQRSRSKLHLQPATLESKENPLLLPSCHSDKAPGLDLAS